MSRHIFGVFLLLTFVPTVAESQVDPALRRWLYMTFHSVSEAAIVMLSVVYAMTGGVILQVARLQLFRRRVGRVCRLVRRGGPDYIMKLRALRKGTLTASRIAM